MQKLPLYIQKQPLAPFIHVDGYSIIEVSAAGSREQLQKLPHTSGDSIGINVFMHFGVNTGSTSFALEHQAYNCASFRVSDERGWTPQDILIDNTYENASTDDTLHSSLNIQSLVEYLKAQGYDVEESYDPGRFVCNWLYYHSLQRNKQDGSYSIFIHVPSFDEKPIDEQLSFAYNAIAAVCDQLQLAPLSTRRTAASGSSVGSPAVEPPQWLAIAKQFDVDI
jgi:pyroglutamyl-peptidase